jgi:hydrogenase nickel incorporation protein HypA/HybF
MHETDMTKALILTVRDWWQSQPEQRSVAKVFLTVGQVHLCGARQSAICL